MSLVNSKLTKKTLKTTGTSIMRSLIKLITAAVKSASSTAAPYSPDYTSSLCYEHYFRDSPSVMFIFLVGYFYLILLFLECKIKA